MPPINIVWFKRDLRIHDHAALSNALKSGPVLALYCWEPAMWQSDDASLSQQAFVGECLKSLRAALNEHGITLHISSMGIIESLTFLIQKQTITSIHSHEETGNLVSYSIDKSVKKWCETHQVEWYEHAQNGVVRRLKSRDEWHANWELHMQATKQTLPNVHNSHPIIELPKQAVTRARGEDKPLRQIGGREKAVDLLNSFLKNRSRRYRGGISSPVKASEASSRLSPYIAWGCISIREVVQACRNTVAQQQAEGLNTRDPLILGLRSFESRLHWHCHFMQKLESEPTLEHQHMHSAHAGIRDEYYQDTESKKRLIAWCSGQTGWPLVDACLAMLRQTGWINFRMRAMLMSSASYLLWLHWRETGLHLAREFVDYEPGIHWPQVQMQSGSTGINTVRIYNPIKQARDQDPRGQFVRQWIPTLRHVPDTWLFEPYRMPKNLQMQYGCILEKDYPLPLVDIQPAMQQARLHITAARKNHLKQDETKKVLHKHGSRTRSRDVQRPKKKTTKAPDQYSLF
ncbi:MAG: deoxyribodipyrimidine photo-lyase/cryptochrome family protein [Methylotenera sp.]